MKNGVILSEAFQARIKAIEVVRAAVNVRARNSEAIRGAADELDTAREGLNK